MGNVVRNYVTEKMSYPVNGKSWLAEVHISIDGGKCFHPSNVREYFFTKKDALAFCEEYENSHH